MRLQRDCNSRWVTDSVMEVNVFLGGAQDRKFISHTICRYGVMVSQWLAKPSNRNVVKVRILLSALTNL